MIDRIAEIRARCEAATPGPWVHEDAFNPNYQVIISNSGQIVEWGGGLRTRQGNAKFIAHSREDIPYLLDCLAALEAEKAELLKEVVGMAKLAPLRRFKEYFDELYGQGLEVANWHMNGSAEPFDSFFDSALEHMDGPLPARPEKGGAK